jgi:hypothetical protein
MILTSTEARAVIALIRTSLETKSPTRITFGQPSGTVEVNHYGKSIAIFRLIAGQIFDEESYETVAHFVRQYAVDSFTEAEQDAYHLVETILKMPSGSKLRKQRIKAATPFAQKMLVVMSDGPLGMFEAIQRARL